MVDIGDDHDQSENNIKNDHERYQLFRDVPDLLDPPDDYHAHQHGDKCADQVIIVGRGLIRRGGAGIEPLVEGIGQRSGHRVGLGHVTGADQAGDHPAGGEYRAEKPPQGFILQTVFHIIHRPPGHGAVGSDLPVVDAQEALGIFGGHSEQAGNPHPHRRARAANGDCSRNPGDISIADRGRQGGHQGGKGGNITLAFFGTGFFGEDQLQGAG